MLKNPSYLPPFSIHTKATQHPRPTYTNPTAPAQLHSSTVHGSMKYSSLCSTCQRMLQPDWEEERRNSPMWPFRPHHRCSKSFFQAVSQNCFICSKIHKAILNGHVIHDGDHFPSWIDGSEEGWETMHFLAQHDHDTPAILIVINCADSRQRSYWINFYLMPRNGWSYLDVDAINGRSNLESQRIAG